MRPTDFGDDGHRGMIGVQLLGQRRGGVDGLPDGGIVAGLEAFGFVAQRPDQDGGMILVAKDGPADHFLLLCDLIGVGVGEVVTLVPEPDADGDAQAQALCFVELGRRCHRRPRCGRSCRRVGRAVAWMRFRRAFDDAGRATA